MWRHGEAPGEPTVFAGAVLVATTVLIVSDPLPALVHHSAGRGPASGRLWSRRSGSNRRPTAYKIVSPRSPWPLPATPASQSIPGHVGQLCFARRSMPQRSFSDSSMPPLRLNPRGESQRAGLTQRLDPLHHRNAPVPEHLSRGRRTGSITSSISRCSPTTDLPHLPLRSKPWAHQDLSRLDRPSRNIGTARE